MNQIERLRDEFVRAFPQIEAVIDRPVDSESGTWHLDIARPGGTPLAVEWRRDRGFGVSSVEPDDPAFGAGPDEIFLNARGAL